MEYLQEIILELNSNTAYTTVGAKQGDNNTRKVRAFLTKNGVSYNLRDNNVNTAYFRFRKPDGKAIINLANVDQDNNYIEITLTAQTLAVAGRGYADITLQDGGDILSTVSFIIIIMASPQVASQAISSDEFGYLNATVEDANHIIYQAEAWAAGTRGGKPVYSDEALDLSSSNNLASWLPLNPETGKDGQDTFKDKVKSKPGMERIYTFTSLNEPIEVSSRQWSLNLESTEGKTTSYESLGTIGNVALNDYGINISDSAAVPTGTEIVITFKERDTAYQNNALYYSQQAALSQEYLANLTVSAETLETGEEATVSKTIIDGHENFHFGLPKGDTGDVNFMTFDIDTNRESINYGQIIITRPDTITPDVTFEVGEDGQLYFQIIN